VAKKLTSKSRLTQGSAPNRVSIEKALNGFVIRSFDGNTFKDITKIAKTKKEAQSVAQAFLS